MGHLDSTDDDVVLQRQGGDRRHLSLAQVAIVVTLLANFGALVWGAATTTASINALRETSNLSISALRESVILLANQGKETQSTVNSLSAVVAVLKDRADKKQ